MLTLVNQDEHVQALQVKNASGSWVDAPPVEGTFVCNIGDMLEDAAGNTVASGNADVEMYVAEAIKGTKEEEYCSARGICDVLTGVCTCSLDYDTSDGDAGLGNEAHNRGDCGVPTAEVVGCPGEIACSGHGVCTGNPKFRCYCRTGSRPQDPS